MSLPVAEYVPGLAVSLGEAVSLVSFSGQVSMTAKGLVGDGSIEQQTEQVFDNIEAVLALGGAGLDDLVSMTIYLTDRAHFSGFNAVRDGRLMVAGARTTSAVVIVAGLVDPRHLVEISGFALVTA
nr:RidA family protein [Kineosporia babensis]